MGLDATAINTEESELLRGLASSQPSDSKHHAAAPQQFVAYGERWFQLALFCLLSMSNALLWITFAPISNHAQNFYGVSTIAINMMSVVFMIAYIPVVFPASYFLDVKGLRFGLLLGAGGNLLGSLLRISGTKHPQFWLVATGQTLAAIAQPFILNAPPLVAANWFPENQRTLATTIASVANPVGVAIGFVLPPSVVGNDNNMLPVLMGIESGVALVIFAIVFFLVKSEPPTPPSASSTSAKEAPSSAAAYLQSLRTLAGDLQFWVLFLMFGLALGTFNTLATLINEVILPYNYNNTQSGALGALVVIAGIVGSGALSVLTDMFHWYKWTLVGSLLLATVAAALFTLSLAPDHFWYLAASAALLGFSMTPVLPISLELGVEITFPIGESISSGLLMASGQLVGTVMIVIFSVMLEHNHGVAVCWVMTVCVAVGAWLMFSFYGSLKRIEHERSVEP